MWRSRPVVIPQQLPRAPATSHSGCRGAIARRAADHEVNTPRSDCRGAVISRSGYAGVVLSQLAAQLCVQQLRLPSFAQRARLKFSDSLTCCRGKT